MLFAVNRSRLTHGLDLANSNGIEIGPLVNPIVRRTDGNIKYVDRASTAELRKWYSRDDKINIDEIMEIDYIWGEQSLTEATGGTEQFDYCIASHVIEHIPDLITWLGEISSILKTGGVACFAVPDKRFTFDYLRSLTTTSDLVDNFLNKLRKPSFRHIYDHFSNFAELDIQTAWSNDFDGSSLSPLNSPAKAYSACVDSIDGDKYVDSHCSVLTQDSFFPLLESISELGLLDFSIKRSFGVKHGMFEFVVQLEKLDPALIFEKKHQAFKTSFETMNNSALLVNYSSNKLGVPKIYYDFGQGFNETETESIQYNEVDEEVQLKFTLPLVDELNLRFDPSDHECDFNISKLTLIDHSGRNSIPLTNIQVLNEIERTSMSSKGWSASSSRNATDPSVLIKI